ncbi:MAG: TetR/AcrR family transcriptional regulator [Chloroflexota bacterium]|nr:TetR/AcrR family transcriptional regulator [Chloroflexota bacterium]
MLAAGYQLFTERGYGPTTLAAVAKLAKVHVQTVHFTFQTKSALFIEVVRTYTAGEDPPRPVAQRPWMREAFDSPVALRSIALVVEFGSEIYRSVASLMPALVSAAQAEPSVAAFAKAVALDRRIGMRALMTSIAAKGQLRTDRTIDQCADIVYTLHNAETYLTLVTGFGWTVEAYKAWLYDALSEQILQPVTRLERRRAARGLTFARRSK